ncbi:hypothetical protein N7489_010946 [Penicillium chrysogenum]|uniref:uncharacterized protein n=1 Tax=Penicillium chrysogenum TaxID=5076 RepID=UPI002398DA56|nr:uncharacterized protein N7489_010946 [Penicillium chrysogenum]KAJ5230238.1 hypothetical protein N7489_010946 [Penicillium chrysogenum]KAJ5271913.1 hypothetical protein N7524_005182 [Penicillium chrysogenum]
MKLSKNQLRRAKKKAQKAETTSFPVDTTMSRERSLPTVATSQDAPADTSTDLLPEPTDPLWEMYKGVVGKFDETVSESSLTKDTDKPEVFFDDGDEIPDEEQEGEPKISKKKRKEMNKLSVAELKAMVRKPEIVEWTDTSAPDPRLLVHIKAHRNVVPVPSHWSLKREYLSSKRGVEKAPFALPKFIQETGISEMRDAALEKQEQSSLKQKQRERVQPKMGKLDIDYQKLYEAFFRFQTKPELTRYGEIYYEGKEYETNLKHLRPGELSDELRDALGMAPGAPPPWLVNQQRYGPPSSYPALKVPGLNAPPPPARRGATILEGDIFGVLQPQQHAQQGVPIEKDLWGELHESEESEEESEAEDEDEDEDEEESGEDGVGAGAHSPSGLETPSGIDSAVPSEFVGAENVSGEFDVRKHHRGTDTEESVHPRSAYQVIPERQTNVEGFFGGDRAYDLSGSTGKPPVLGADDQNRKRKKPGDVEVSVNLDAIQSGDGLSKESLQSMYESQRQQQNPSNWAFQEDLSDMLAQENRKRLRKEEERRRKH